MSDNDIIGYIIPDFDVWLSIIEETTKETISLMELFPPKLPIVDVFFEDMVVVDEHYTGLFCSTEAVEHYEVIYKGRRFVLWPYDIEEIEFK